MVRALIIDDESQMRDDIRNKITTYFNNEIEIIGEADSVVSGLASIKKLAPDLLFLDVHLSDGTAFDILTQLTKKAFDIIFITGFDNNAIKAIKVGALDYILKPIDIEEFKEATVKAIKNKITENPIEKLIEVSNEYFKGIEKRRIILKTADTVYAVYEDDILYCKSEGNYTTFHTIRSEKIIVSKSMKKNLEILSEDVFVRCHQSYLINKKYALKYNKNGILVLSQGIKIPVSSRRKDYTLKKVFD
ncbi:response regulator [Flavobacteriaceae bacterium AU392]|nr:DNA-binding response regulator [Flavobacteriaceae bacterium]RKM86571.1 response regulator [Flavobacteriaceae bacterium AU392]